MQRVPIVYSAHHASYDFGSFSERCALTLEERKRFSDLGTDLTVPHNGIVTFVAQYSRGLVDLNRAPDSKELFPEYDFGKPEAHSVWKDKLQPSTQEQEELFQQIYKQYHQQIEAAVAEHGSDCFVVAWDNTAHYNIGKNIRGEEEMMRPIILSNHGNENSTTGSAVSCDPDVLSQLGESIQKRMKSVGLPCVVAYNLVFKGGYITQHYSNYTQRSTVPTSASVQSFQIEYDMSLTHDPVSLAPDYERIRVLRELLTDALISVVG